MTSTSTVKQGVDAQRSFNDFLGGGSFTVAQESPHTASGDKAMAKYADKQQTHSVCFNLMRHLSDSHG